MLHSSTTIFSTSWTSAALSLTSIPKADADGWREFRPLQCLLLCENTKQFSNHSMLVIQTCTKYFSFFQFASVWAPQSQRLSGLGWLFWHRYLHSMGRMRTSQSISDSFDTMDPGGMDKWITWHCTVPFEAMKFSNDGFPSKINLQNKVFFYLNWPCENNKDQVWSKIVMSVVTPVNLCIWTSSTVVSPRVIKQLPFKKWSNFLRLSYSILPLCDSTQIRGSVDLVKVDWNFKVNE